MSIEVPISIGGVISGTVLGEIGGRKAQWCWRGRSLRARRGSFDGEEVMDKERKVTMEAMKRILAAASHFPT